MTKITLKIEGKKKAFKQDYVSWGTRRKAMELEIEGAKGELNPLDYLDKQADFIVEFFSIDEKPQFTKEQLENGLAADDVKNTLYDVIGVGSLGMKSREELESVGESQENPESEHQQKD